MLARRDAAGNAIHGSDVKPMHALHWRGHGSLGSKSASTVVRDTYGDTVDDVLPIVAGSSVSSFVEDDDDWSLGDTPLSRNAGVRTSLFVDFAAIQTRCRELSFAVPDKAGDVFGLELRGLDASQESGEAGMPVATLEASKAEQLAKTDALESHDRGLLDENQSLENQMVVVRDEKERHKAWGVESSKAITDGKVELERGLACSRGLGVGR